MRQIIKHAVKLVLIGLTGLMSNAALAQSPPYDNIGSVPDGPMDAASYAEYLKAMQARRNDVDDGLARADRASGTFLFDLGTRLNQGYVDGRPELVPAYNLYEAAADKGEVRALSVMCTAYLLGINRPVNAARAMTYCNKLDVKHPTLIFSVAYDYDLGLSGPKDEAMAMQEYLSAAQPGYGLPGNAEAMNMIGQKLLKQPDKTSQARQWFRKAARGGSLEGMVNLAKMAEAGQGGLQDSEQAAWLYTNAARFGHKGAIAWLAAQTTPPMPRPRVSLRTAKGWLITQTTEDNKGRHTKPFALQNNNKVLVALTGKDEFTKSAMFQCYINAEHVVDVCLTLREYPVGYNLAAIVHEMLGPVLIADPKDSRDQSTAKSVFLFRYNLGVGF
ncbi:tetratricopeptide repeat protein [Asticcacaulis sp. BYS171W]|uniref:Tetratricopeptide repeat protein n=1 Tax=Asticcacaulis aquaticus TaxID=2984212 RepID=A0ABT5HSY8_9CAUL|nr:tetratricopeptide repeat protein [Asticcacaulis aquaticus]MDC7683193.1 tetratricopeptide repeat protein [Asticcacaulis aquaticus]